jgi:Uma2 family endonuclease
MTAEAIDPMDPILAHRGPWTEDDYLALPDHEGQRIELVDGDLIVSGVGDLQHQELGFRLCRELDRQLPDEFAPFHEANVRLETGRILIPDVVVTTNLGNTQILDAADVVLVGEVVSPSSRSMDRILKPELLAEAGITWYLRVERDRRLELFLHHGERSSYRVHSRAGVGEWLELPELGCEIEVDALLRRRG